MFCLKYNRYNNFFISLIDGAMGIKSEKKRTKLGAESHENNKSKCGANVSKLNFICILFNCLHLCFYFREKKLFDFSV